MRVSIRLAKLNSDFEKYVRKLDSDPSASANDIDFLTEIGVELTQLENSVKRLERKAKR